MYLDRLMPHQAAGVLWMLANPRGMLAWEMGVGKTATAARAAEHVMLESSYPTLVLCLASARENWRREIERFALDQNFPPKVQILHHHKVPIDPAANFVITNYDKLLNGGVIRRLRGRGRWSAIIADEAHVLKTPDAQRTKLVYGGARCAEPLMNYSDCFWPLTGTPMPNHPGELWTHAYHLWPSSIMYRDGKPMELWEFELGFCEMRHTARYGSQIVGGKNLSELRDRLSPFINRLKRKDVLDLPPLKIDSWPLDMETTSGVGKWPTSPELVAKLSHYGSSIEQFDNSTLDAYLACIKSEWLPLATLRRETGTLKAIATCILLGDEFEQGAPKTVVFAYHRDAIEVLAKGLKDQNPAVLHGGTPLAKRDEEIGRFQTDPTCRVFIGQLEAAGASINLQAAERVVFVEASWSPGDNDQALSRVYRAGQTKPVLVRFTYLKGSVDEVVNRALARKAAMIAQVVN